MTQKQAVPLFSGQKYIGAPNAVVVCINSRTDIRTGGELYHAYSRAPSPFVNLEQLVFLMEQLFDELQFPYLGTRIRVFRKISMNYKNGKERPQVMKDEELLAKHGDLGTYIIRVQQRQNSSWQGRITWVDQDKTMNFRSVWEMVKMIENSLDTGSGEDKPEIVWDN